MVDPRSARRAQKLSKLQLSLLEPRSRTGAHGPANPKEETEDVMSDKPLPVNLAEYSANHRIREHHEDGYVDVTGKREKKWRGWYHVYKLNEKDGSSTRIKRSRVIGPCAGMTKAAAKDEHRAWIRRFNSQPVAEDAGCKVAHLCDDYLIMRNGDWDESTQKTNRSVFDQLIKPEIGERPIEKVTAEDLKRLVNGWADRTWKTPKGTIKHGTSHSYAKKGITMIRAIFDLAQERDLVTKNPARSINVRLKMPKRVTRPDKSIFPPEHLFPFLAELGPRDSLIVWISLLGATRPNEAFAVKGADVGPDWVCIKRALNRRRKFKDTKTGTERYVHLPPDTAKQIHQWIVENKIGPNDLVFQNRDGGPLNRANVLKRKIRTAAERAKIPVLDVDFQMLRRSFATIAGALGLDLKSIQSQLGHARPDMTATEYMQPVDAVRVEQMKRLEDILRGRVKMPADLAAKLGSRMVQ
jgi:integrase